MKLFTRRRPSEPSPDPAADSSPQAAAPVLPRRPVDVILHVGMGKTGTSSVQFFLRDNRDRLADLGVLFPQTPGRARHTRLGLFARPDDELAELPEWPRQNQSDPTQFRRVFRRRLLREMEVSGLSRVLFTDEVLFGASEATLNRLGRFTNRVGRSTRLIVYLRRQDDHMVSRYQQGVKVGWIKRLDEWADEDMSDLYDYHVRLGLHGRSVRPDLLVVRRFEPEGFRNGSIYQDFLDAAGIDLCADDLAHGSNRNESLDADSVEFLRLLNTHRVESEGATPGLIDNRAIARRLTEAASGPVLSLPAARLDRFMDRWEQTNELVARRYLSDPSGRLFRMTRKGNNITTEQRLDPARVDHFLALLELPEQLHAPLRSLAEREAKAR